MAIRSLVISPGTLQPTEAGKVWLQRAGVRSEDILLFNRASLSPNRYQKGKSLGNSTMANKVTILPTLDTQIQRTLALLKVAQVIVKERFEKLYRIVHEGRQGGTNTAMSYSSSPQKHLKKNAAQATAAKTPVKLDNLSLQGSWANSPVPSSQGKKIAKRRVLANKRVSKSQ